MTAILFAIFAACGPQAGAPDGSSDNTTETADTGDATDTTDGEPDNPERPARGPVEDGDDTTGPTDKTPGR